VQHVRDLYAPQDHPVFELVPPTFGRLAEQFYREIGSPVISRTNVWDVYMGIRAHFYHLEGIPDDYQLEWDSAITQAREESDARDANMPIELIPDLRGLCNGLDVARPDGSYYMGGVNNGQGIGAILRVRLPHGALRLMNPSDATHNDELNRLLNEDEPAVENNNGLGLNDVDDAPLIVDWFTSDEEDGAAEW
jgi:hypothetical protein